MHEHGLQWRRRENRASPWRHHTPVRKSRHGAAAWNRPSRRARRSQAGRRSRGRQGPEGGGGPRHVPGDDGVRGLLSDQNQSSDRKSTPSRAPHCRTPSRGTRSAQPAAHPPWRASPAGPRATSVSALLSFPVFLTERREKNSSSLSAGGRHWPWLCPWRWAHTTAALMAVLMALLWHRRHRADKTQINGSRPQLCGAFRSVTRACVHPRSHACTSSGTPEQRA